ncbi:RNA polymerase sporulation sigma factor SigH [Proteiniclasticum aestuarii]|uniref:RNA polymerase sporulation sigma factor SigH n=1 Tax=Proteiniclasticum aestuarii TaxID=2817862 RepID=UPI001F611C4E|nr:RNA polymerase sporulation sigma factor SigH [Proteiniclasticum aestuarii]
MTREEQKYKALSDEEIVRLAQNGDKSASEFITAKYLPYVRNKSRAYFLVGGEVEDIMQEGLIGLYEAIKDFSDGRQASFKTFMDICVTRQIMTALKAASRQKHIPLNTYVSLNKPVYVEDTNKSYQDMLVTSKTDDPESLYIDGEKTEEISKEIRNSLSDFEYRVLRLYLQGVSYLKIANVLNKEEKAIDNAIQRIRKKLSRNLESASS